MVHVPERRAGRDYRRICRIIPRAGHRTPFSIIVIEANNLVRRATVVDEIGIGVARDNLLAGCRRGDRDILHAAPRKRIEADTVSLEVGKEMDLTQVAVKLES